MLTLSKAMEIVIASISWILLYNNSETPSSKIWQHILQKQPSFFYFTLNLINSNA